MLNTSLHLKIKLLLNIIFFPFLFRIGLAAAQALGLRGAHVVVSSRRQANVDKAVALLSSHNIRVTGTTCNVGIGEDREKLIQMVFSFMQPQQLGLGSVLHIISAALETDSGSVWGNRHFGVQCGRQPILWKHPGLHRGCLG